MALQAIALSINPAPTSGAVETAAGDTACAFCGAATGRWSERGYGPPDPQKPAIACALCSLPQHLERPRIDEEAALVWLPEISQPALNTTLREIHMALHALGEDVHADAVFRRQTSGLPNLYHARAILAERRGPTEARLGTTSPRELGLALLELSPAAYARRAELLDGLRLLPLGRFFVDDEDVYPEIVGFWREGATTAVARLNEAR